MTIARQQPRVRRSAWPAVITFLALAALGIGLWAYMATRPESALVVRRDIVTTVPLRGEIITPPQAQAEIGAPFQAPVERVFASVGGRVRKGDVLVELSYPSAEVAYQQARERVRAAERALAGARQQYQAPVASAERELATARTMERAARQSARTSAFPESTGGSGTPPETTGPAGTAPSPEKAVADRVAAEQALEQARADLEMSLAPYERELEAAREALKEAQSGAKIAAIRAPIDGSVLQLNASPGQEVGRDSKVPVAVIVDLGALQIQAPMEAEQASVVKPGLPVTLTIEQVPHTEFPGEVSRLTTRPGGVLGGQQYLALIDFENERGLVKPGMKGTAAVRIGEVRDVPAVPSDAVDKDQTGRPIVKVLRNGQWITVVVETGLSDGRYTEIKSGLQEGDRVQVTPDLV